MKLKPNRQICPLCDGNGDVWVKPNYALDRKTCPKCHAEGQIPIELKPGIYGQVGVPPIVMCWDEYTNENNGPFYLLLLRKSGHATILCKIDDGHHEGWQILEFLHCRLATPEECEGIEPWEVPK